MARNISLDILKVFLAILVVLIHLSFLSDKIVVLSQLIINGICRLAVPLFLIISGYYFVSVNSKQKLFKWVSRLCILYIVWMLIYSFNWVGKFDLKQSLFVTVFGYFHLWYLIGTLLSGVLLFLVRNKKWMVWAFLVLFLIGFFIQVLVFNGIVDKGWYNLYLYRNFLFFCLPFMGMGYLIANKKNANYSPSISLIILSLLCVIGESYINYRLISTGELVGFDLMLSSTVACPLIFLYIKNKEVLRNTKDIALFSTAIYLVHPIVLNYIYLINLEGLPSFVQKISVFVFIFLLSYMLILLNKKFKFLL